MPKYERIWAMRTSRDNQQHRDFIKSQMWEHHVLRQGWGSYPEQDLRKVDQKLNVDHVSWENLDDPERWAWGHWKFLGEDAKNKEKNSTMLVNDIVLVPNMPKDGLFTLCKLTGRYEYKIDETLEDFGHIRQIEIITPGGVANNNPLVSSGVRRSLKCRSRLWWLGDHASSISEIIKKQEMGFGDKLREGMDHAVRAKGTISQNLREALDALAKDIANPLQGTLQAAEWEPVLVDALSPLFRDIQIIPTGGPNERGADIEIHIPNPFDPQNPWLVIVQVKDYDGEIGEGVSEQLGVAISSRLDSNKNTGKIIGVYLACTRATPSSGLESDIKKLSDRYGVPISCVYGHNLMKLFACGLFASSQYLLY